MSTHYKLFSKSPSWTWYVLLALSTSGPVKGWEREWLNKFCSQLCPTACVRLDLTHDQVEFVCLRSSPWSERASVPSVQRSPCVVTYLCPKHVGHGSFSEQVLFFFFAQVSYKTIQWCEVRYWLINKNLTAAFSFSLYLLHFCGFKKKCINTNWCLNATHWGGNLRD